MRISDWSSDVCSSDLHRHGFECARIDQSADHRLADLGERGEFAHQPLPVADLIERDGALRRHPRGQFAGRAIFDDRAPRVGEGGAGEHHAQPTSEESRVGKEWVSTLRSRWSQYHYKKNT